jgi:hypothetical protein
MIRWRSTSHGRLLLATRTPPKKPWRVQERTRNSPRAAARHRGGVLVDAVARLDQGKVIFRLLVLQVISVVEDKCVQYGMVVAVSNVPRTR